MMTTKEFKAEFAKLRENSQQIITVSNSEWYSLFKDEIRNSIAIEGVFANRNELKDVLERNKSTSDTKTAAILGYFESASAAYEYANNLFKTDEFALRVSDIRQFHSLLMRYEEQIGTFNGIRGDFRRNDAEVTKASFTPLQGLHLLKTMPIFVQWINEKLRDPNSDPIQLATASHILFETIHPFSDGNGRVGRILLSFLLIGSGFSNIAIKGVTKPQREKYYGAMEAGDDEYDKLLRKIETGKKPSTALIDSYGQNSDFSELEKIIREQLLKALDRLKSKDFLRFHADAELPLRDAASFFNYSQDYLRNLINKGKLRASKKGKLWYVRVRDMERYVHSQEE
jgi:Fic family protein